MNIMKVRPLGHIHLKVKRGSHKDYGYQLRNKLRDEYLWGWLTTRLARAFTKITGLPTLVSELRGVHIRNGKRIDLGVLSRRVITNAGAAFLADNWYDGSKDIADMNYHGVGTGTTAADPSDTGLEAESTSVLDPTSTRATGIKSKPAANQVQSEGELIFQGSAAITEHGLFDSAATGGGVLWDRHVFSPRNMANTDILQVTYICTINSGG